MSAAVDALANPIWHSLQTCLAHLAEVSGGARRLPPEVTLLAGFAEPTAEAFASLAKLQSDGMPSVIFLHEPIVLPAGWREIDADGLLQMVQVRDAQMPAAPADMIDLRERDAGEMVGLAKLTKPGPFGRRTRELGTYVGVRREGKLVAMAGERLRLQGYTEVSAVCTHPEFLGRGLAGGLMGAVIERMRAKGETPFLHVRASNTRAVELYKRLGFEESRRLYFMVVVPARI
jgi:ribosomal protein S18 acetylase RimI-like enzyme